jgi:histidine triad (HIT) family protein
MPKWHISDVKSMDESHAFLAGKVLLMAKELSNKLSGSGSFRLITNNGSDAGQSVFHLHFHFLSGKKMLDF